MSIKITQSGISTNQLSQSDFNRIGDFLTTVADEFSNHSCNDFSFTSTVENKAIVIEIIQHHASSGWDQNETAESFIDDVNNSTGKDICSYDNWVAEYFAHRCQQLSTTESNLTTSELVVVGELLEQSADEHEEWAADGDDGFEYTLEATTENKAFIAAVVEHHGADDWASAVEEIMASDDEVIFPDCWIMRYYADRCKALSTG